MISDNLFGAALEPPHRLSRTASLLKAAKIARYQRTVAGGYSETPSEGAWHLLIRRTGVYRNKNNITDSFLLSTTIR